MATSAPVRDGAVAAPAAHLRPFVARYSGFRERGVPPGTHRGLPAPWLTLILTLDDPLEVAAHPDARQRPERYDAMIGGLHTAPALVTHPGSWSGVQVDLSPLGARVLLGVPAGDLAGIDVHLEDLVGAWALRTRERLLAASGWPGRFAVLDREFTRRLAAQRAGDIAPEVARAWSLLVDRRGLPPVADLAAEVGWSGRRLLTAFRRDVGLAPKEAARVTRFHHARRRLFALAAEGRPPALADLAASTGYYDQAHLAREFRALAGVAPSVLLADQFRFVQAGRGPDDAGS